MRRVAQRRRFRDDDMVADKIRTPAGSKLLSRSAGKRKVT
jgi:hypothetical protein